MIRRAIGTLGFSLSLTLAGLLGASTASAQPVAGPIALLRDASSSRTRLRAMQTIAQLRPAGGREALEAQLDDRSARHRLEAVNALSTLRDRASLPALQAHRGDRDRRVRAAIARLIATLSAGPPSPGPQAVVEHPQLATDWGRVRCVIELRAVEDRTQRDPGRVAMLQSAVRTALGTYPDLALNPGALPRDADRRVRSGALRSYGLDANLTTYETRDNPGVAAVRAEVQLLLLTGATHAIAGALMGAATAQESAPNYPGAPDPHPRVAAAAMEAAVRGALNQMEGNCAPPAGRSAHGHGRR
ncbi:MAG: HEAT repeat domain-containing protein [Myxococcales bacterium]|nr:HEAT repeat domain-containing protein [Myxococcales bacterium]